jgi:hypothetical protein
MERQTAINLMMIILLVKVGLVCFLSGYQRGFTDGLMTNVQDYCPVLPPHYFWVFTEENTTNLTSFIMNNLLNYTGDG